MYLSNPVGLFFLCVNTNSGFLNLAAKPILDFCWSNYFLATYVFLHVHMLITKVPDRKSIIVTAKQKDERKGITLRDGFKSLNKAFPQLNRLMVKCHHVGVLSVKHYLRIQHQILHTHTQKRNKKKNLGRKSENQITVQLHVNVDFIVTRFL